MSIVNNTQRSTYYIAGIYSIQNIKYDLLKIIEPYDGYMFNRKDTDRVRALFLSYLSDLRNSKRINEYHIYSIIKENAITFDVSIKLHKDRSAKKLKIHVGTFQYTPVTLPKENRE